MQVENISNHAKLRLAQRNLNEEDLAFILRYGQEIHRTGASFFFLGERDIPDKFVRRQSRLVGSTVVVDERGIVTVYRNKHAIKKIKRKSKLKEFSGRRKNSGRYGKKQFNRNN